MPKMVVITHSIAEFRVPEGMLLIAIMVTTVMVVMVVMVMIVMVIITCSKEESRLPEGIPGWQAQLCHLVCNILAQLL